MATEQQTAGQVARFYTKSRKFPRMVGRFPDGTRMPGGPYTLTQFAVGVLVGALAAWLGAIGVWDSGSVLTNSIIVVSLAFGAVWLARYIPSGDHSPLLLAEFALGAVSAPSAGTYRGRTLTLPRPTRVRGRVLALDHLEALDTPEGEAEVVEAPDVPTRIERPSAAPAAVLAAVAATPAPAPAAAPAPMPRAMSGVERLLAQSRGER